LTFTDAVILATVIALSAVSRLSAVELLLLTLPLAAWSRMPVSWFGLSPAVALP